MQRLKQKCGERHAANAIRMEVRHSERVFGFDDCDVARTRECGFRQRIAVRTTALRDAAIHTPRQTRAFAAGWIDAPNRGRHLTGNDDMTRYRAVNSVNCE